MEHNNACAAPNRLSATALLALCLFLLGGFSLPEARASSMDGSYHMIVNGRSYHMDKASNGQKFNENNYGSGIEYEFSRAYGSRWVPFVTSSAFSDSFNNLSYYAGGGNARRFFIRNGWHFDIGYFGFLMARKDMNNYEPFPGVLPVASLGTRNVSVNMTYVPPVKEGLVQLLFFQLKISTD